MTWNFTERRSSESEISYLTRHRIPNEGYANRMLLGINAIIERHGGRELMVLPPSRELIRTSEVGEESVLYCDGMTFRNGYNRGAIRGMECPQHFWTKVFGNREDWEEAAVIGDLKRFYELEDLSQVSDLSELLWPSRGPIMSPKDVSIKPDEPVV